MLKKTLALLWLIMAVGTDAATISSHGYTLDTDTEIVTGGGLQWFQWNKTVGLSIDQALLKYPKMRLASNAEMADLFNAFNFGGTFNSTEEIYQTFSLPFDSNSEGVHTIFGNLFGWTLGPAHGLPDGSEAIYYTLALFGSDPNENGLYNRAEVYDDAVWVDHIDHLARFTADTYGTDYYQDWAGVALVSNVPLPAPIYLLFSALLGLGALKRRKTV